MKQLVIFALLNFGALAIGGLFTGGGVSSEWYASLNKAPWTPPGWVFGIYRQVIQGIPFGNNPVSNNGLILIAFLTVAFSLFFGNIKLTTIVKEDGIHVQFFPLQLSLKTYAFSELAHIYLREYSGLKEYGGWGYRFGINGGMAYTASGSDGLQLVTIDGKKLLIGTQNPDELKEVLLRLNQYRPVGD